VTTLTKFAYWKAYTKSDTADFEFGMSDGIFVGASGSVIAFMASGETVTFNAVPAGAILPLQAKRIGASSTAANFVILYEGSHSMIPPPPNVGP
jgi:hypothetical protein